jgi:hypothetical protein
MENQGLSMHAFAPLRPVKSSEFNTPGQILSFRPDTERFASAI